jgi:kumamolisin
MLLSGVAAAVVGTDLLATRDRAQPPTSGTTSAPSVSGEESLVAPGSPLVASGPMTSLNDRGELGTVLGGASMPGQVVPVDQRDLIVVTLPFQNSARLSAYLTAISDPTSPLYGHYLTNEEFAEEYGAPASAQQGIASYLASKGLTIAYESSDHLTIGATGTLGELEGAFGVSFQMYSKLGQSFFAPDASPAVPASLAPWIQSVVGLTDYNFGYAPQIALQPPAGADAGSPAGSGVRDYPNEMTEEFQLNKLWNATGNASAGVVPSFAEGVVLATGLWDLNSSAYCPYSLTDIEQFFHDGGQQTYVAPDGMPHQLPSPHDHANYNVTGDPTVAPGTGNCTSPVGGANIATEELDFEMTIDQEWSGEDAPGALIEPTYVGGEGVTASDADLTLLESWIADGNIPNLSLFSQSFGGGENSTSWESEYQEMAAEGITVLASSGDNNGASGFGAEPLCQSSTDPYSWDTQGTPIVDYPGSSPNVLSVGGTANLQLASSPENSASILAGQTVWNWCPSADSGESAGSTGGVSSEFVAPTYQTSVPAVEKAMQWAINVTETGNFTTGPPPAGCEGCADGTVASPTSARAVPDIAGPAANNTGYMAGGWVTGYGGTSFSSPSVAGVLGSIIAFDGHRLGFVNPTLYQLEESYLDGSDASLPFPVAPTYYVDNYSNAFFDGGRYYNTSSGWGVPQAYNIALLLGKPFLSTNPTGAAQVGAAYPVTAAIRDDSPLASVGVAYREPGSSTWSNASLSLTSGSLQNGSWTGLIPAPNAAGTLEYCIDAVDKGQGNSWSPYNQSAWAATGGEDPSFGCTVPFHVGVQPSSTGYTVKFAEQGLPADTLWGVQLTLPSGARVTHGQNSSVSEVLSFKEPNGKYGYAFLEVPGYYIHKGAGTGTITVAGANPATTTTDWTLTKYTVKFSESGLAHGAHWSVTIGGSTRSGTGTSLSFSLPNGSYSYTITATGYTVSSSPPSPVTIDGAGVVILVKFT